jgi:hypothetical protein
VSVRRGAGVSGSDRITLIFADGAIKKQWLRVKVLTGGAVGLAGADLFYFGNAIGESGNLTTDAKVTTLDVSLTRANQISFPTPPPALFNKYDFNRDHKVNTMDVSLARSNLTTVMSALKLIAPPVENLLGLGAPAGSGADAGLTPVQTGSSSGLSTTMDALAATVVPAAAPRLGTALGTGLIDALGFTSLPTRLQTL